MKLTFENILRKIVIVLLVLSIVSLLSFAGYIIYLSLITDDNCLKNFATKYCREKGESYIEHFSYSFTGYQFVCGFDEREIEGNKYKFTEQEIKECRK